MDAVASALASALARPALPAVRLPSSEAVSVVAALPPGPPEQRSSARPRRAALTITEQPAGPPPIIVSLNGYSLEPADIAAAAAAAAIGEDLLQLIMCQQLV